MDYIFADVWVHSLSLIALSRGFILFLIIFLITLAIMVPWIGWNLTYKKLQPTQRLFKETGNFKESVLTVLTRRVDIPRDYWIKLLKSSEKTFDSFAMASWHYIEHPDFFTILEDKIKNTECIFRFFILNPESEFAEIREKEEKESRIRLRDRIRSSINHIKHWINEPGKDERHDRVHIYLYDWYPTYSFVRSDDIMYVSNYLFHDTGDNAPTIILNNAGKDSPFQSYLSNIKLLINEGVAKVFK